MSTFLILGQVPSELTSDPVLLWVSMLTVNTIYSYSVTDCFSRSAFSACGMCQAVSTLEK